MPLTRKSLTLLLLLAGTCSPLRAANMTIMTTTLPNVFVPANVTINVGDSVTWVIGATHNLYV